MVFNFGKYKGKDVSKVRDLDPGYLMWAWDKIGKRLDKGLYNYIDANLEELKAEAEIAREEYLKNLGIETAENGTD
jgi:hypothetical protein